jgi:hypothetical protein
VDCSAVIAVEEVLKLLAEHNVLSVPVFLTEEYALTQPVAGTTETWKRRRSRRGAG